ncbi:MAG: YdcF family protein [Elusimicrobiota bacterium]
MGRRGKAKKRRRSRFFRRNVPASYRIAGAAAALLAVLLGSAVWVVGWFLDYSDEPEPADLMVVLAGGFARPFYAADLFHEGIAPEIWLARPYRGPGIKLALEAGVRIPTEESINREILLKRGVPASRIHFYGREVMSTANEAAALGRALDLHGKRILIVTSRTHARRARWVFRTSLPGVDIRVTATPYEGFTRKWWTQQFLARAAVLEISKTLYYLFGGRFMSSLEDTPYTQ